MKWFKTVQREQSEITGALYTAPICKADIEADIEEALSRLTRDNLSKRKSYLSPYDHGYAKYDALVSDPRKLYELLKVYYETT